MDQAAASDIARIESWGYTRNEAIDLVIRRALAEERDLAEDGSAASTRGQRAYLDGLRDICMAEAG